MEYGVRNTGGIVLSVGIIQSTSQIISKLQQLLADSELERSEKSFLAASRAITRIAFNPLPRYRLNRDPSKFSPLIIIQPFASTAKF